MAEAKVTFSHGEETYYKSLNKALDEASSGDTVTLCRSADIGNVEHTITEGVTFVGGEYTVSGTSSTYFENYGTIVSGKFESIRIYNVGSVSGGEFSILYNYGTVTRGKFETINCYEGSSLSGPVILSDVLDYQGSCSIDLSLAVFDRVRGYLYSAIYESLPISSLNLPEGYAVTVGGNVVSELPALGIGIIESHSHTFETFYDSTHHWSVCDCGNTTDKAEHSEFEYTDNGDGTHDYVCSICRYVAIDNEKHTAVTNSYDCICEAPVIAVIDGTLGSKATATDDDINALVNQLKAYINNGATTIIVTGEKPAMIEVDGFAISAIGAAIYSLSGSEIYDENNPYNGTIDPDPSGRYGNSRL